jgi:hypothetical protein
MLIGTLNVVTRPVTQRTAGPNGRRKLLTEVIVRMGGMPIADRIIPGKWDVAAALAEFRKAPQRFIPRPHTGMTVETLKGIAA